MATIVAQRISQMLYKAGRTKADSIVLPDRVVSFADWVDIELQSFRDALRAGRGYVECCCEPDGKDGASEALKQIDAVLDTYMLIRLPHTNVETY